MKEDIEASQKDGNQGKEDGVQDARDGTSIPAVAFSFLLGLLCCGGSKAERPKLEPIHMSFDVWCDVLQFITRKEMASRFSLACYGLKELCWPRLHGRKVKPHMVEPLYFMKERDRGRTKSNVLWKDFIEKIPIATNPPPNYIQGFKSINIYYLDSEVLQFIRNISPLLTNLRLSVCRINTDCILHNLRILFDAFNGCTTISCLHIPSSITISISELRQKLPGILENIPAITMTPFYNDQVDVNELIMAKFEIGKSFVLDIRYWPLRYLPINKIQEAFQTAKQRQSFLILLDNGPSMEAFQLANEETGEVLALEYIGNGKCELYRCPSQEVQQWREEAKKLLKEETYTTHITYYCVDYSVYY